MQKHSRNIIRFGEMESAGRGTNFNLKDFYLVFQCLTLSLFKSWIINVHLYSFKWLEEKKINSKFFFLWPKINIYIRILSRCGSWEMAPKWRSEAQVSCLQLLGFFYNCTAAHFYLERSFHFAIPSESQFSRRLKKINLKPEKSNSEMLKIKHNILLRFSNFIILNCGTAEKGSPSEL